MVLDSSSGIYRANLLDDAKVQVYTVTWTVTDQVTSLLVTGTGSLDVWAHCPTMNEPVEPSGIVSPQTKGVVMTYAELGAYFDFAPFDLKYSYCTTNTYTYET